jgi:hypothetical protein
MLYLMQKLLVNYVYASILFESVCRIFQHINKKLLYTFLLRTPQRIFKLQASSSPAYLSSFFAFLDPDPESTGPSCPDPIRIRIQNNVLYSTLNNLLV